MRRIDKAKVDLPEPELAREAEPLPGLEDEADLVNRLHQALRVVKADTQVLNPQDRGAHPLLLSEAKL